MTFYCGVVIVAVVVGIVFRLAASVTSAMKSYLTHIVKCSLRVF